MSVSRNAEAGPSKNSKMVQKKKPNQKGNKMSKAKLEAQAVEALDKQAMEYVCLIQA